MGAICHDERGRLGSVNTSNRRGDRMCHQGLVEETSAIVHLELIDESIWLVEGEIVSFYGFPYPTRSVVVRLRAGDLWVWSPVKLSEALQEVLNGLGTVRHLVSPNKIHHLFLSEWQSAYPDARLWGPASTIRKRPDLKFAGILTEEAPKDWGEEIVQFWFRGSFAMDEVVFFHRPSSTAISTAV